MDCGGAYCGVLSCADFYIGGLGAGRISAHPQGSYRTRFNQKIRYAGPWLARFQQFSLKAGGRGVCQRGRSGFRFASVALCGLYRARRARYPCVD